MSLRADFMAQKRLDEEEKEIKTIDQLKAENKELIRKNANKRTSLKKKQLHITQLKSELEVEKDWHKTADEISKANNKYTRKLKQAIENVREIAKEHVPRCDIPSYECDYERDCEACHYSDLKQILQICDEVTNENNA